LPRHSQVGSLHLHSSFQTLNDVPAGTLFNLPNTTP
jgi:hypothetical protein